MFDGFELKAVFGPLQLVHTDSTNPCFHGNAHEGVGGTF